MNEQEYLQRIMDILMDNAHEMCAVDGDTQDVILDVNMDGVQTVAREICNVFKPVQKDALSKREQALDDAFERMGVKPRIYHFTDISTFKAITIATIDDAVSYIYVRTYLLVYFALGINPATRTTNIIDKLRDIELYGVAICDIHDNFNKLHNRNKAKGQLMQHLLKVQKK